MDLPQPPADQDLRNIIDKLAQFVARNGPDFEHMTKTKQKNNSKFSFLFGGEFYHYYTYKVNAEQAILRQKGPQQQQQPPSGFYNRPPPGAGPTGSPGWRGPPPPQRGGAAFHSRPPPSSPQPGGPPPGYHSESWGMPMAPTDQQTVGGKPRALMDIPTYQPPGGGGGEGSALPPSNSVTITGAPPSSVEEDKLEGQITDAEKQQTTLREQIGQSEKNLAAQKVVTDEQVRELTSQTIRNSRKEHLELLSHDTAVSLGEIDNVIQPIIDSCTKETIGSGKAWIFQNSATHDKNRLLAHYLAYRVTEPEANFQLKLHLIYLMNDVLHHCVRKNAEELKGSLESVAVEMFCSAWTSSSSMSDGDPSVREAKLTKLIKLWQDKSIFSTSTLNKMCNVPDTWVKYEEQLALDYEYAIKEATKELTDTYKSYASQHNAFVTHAANSIKSLDVKNASLKEQITQLRQTRTAPPPVSPSLTEGDAANLTPPPTKKTGRGSRWDTGSDGSVVPHQTANFVMPPSSVLLPDFSRPPPGFGGPPSTLPPHSAQNVQPPPHQQAFAIDENSLLPTLQYHDLPAGLMVPLVKMEDSGYKPLDPKTLRLPPPTPPTERLLAALEQFYAPPSHDRPRDPEGWEMLGLYEWSRAKTAAIKQKADDIEAGRRDRSPTISPDPYAEDATQESAAREKEPPTESRHRKRYRSRSRSRTRSRSRESTPEQKRSRANRSPSPDSGYSLPSYLTKRSPSPERSPLPPPRSKDKRKSRRSPTPPETSFKGFGGTPKQLDSSNKGHQMMQKMGWKGSGLGSGEGGIVEPISGGEVREKQDQFRGIGHGSDPFEAFRKSKAGSFYTRMKDRDRDHPPRKSSNK